MKRKYRNNKFIFGVKSERIRLKSKLYVGCLIEEIDKI